MSNAEARKLCGQTKPAPEDEGNPGSLQWWQPLSTDQSGIATKATAGTPNSDCREELLPKAAHQQQQRTFSWGKSGSMFAIIFSMALFSAFTAGVWREMRCQGEQIRTLQLQNEQLLNRLAAVESKQRIYSRAASANVQGAVLATTTTAATTSNLESELVAQAQKNDQMLDSIQTLEVKNGKNKLTALRKAGPPLYLMDEGSKFERSMDLRLADVESSYVQVDDKITKMAGDIVQIKQHMFAEQQLFLTHAKLQEMLEEVPGQLTNEVTIATWKRLGPLSVEDIVAKSPKFFQNSNPMLTYGEFGKYTGFKELGSSVAKYGIGRYEQNGGSIMEGMFMNNKMNGYGRSIGFNGAYYVGDYKNDWQHGMGKQVSPDGTVKEGEFSMGRFIG